jgi:hypothetical protein
VVIEKGATDIPPRRQVALAVLCSAAVSLVCAWAVAGAIRHWEARHDIGNYWLIPINNTHFWFYLMCPGALVVVTWWAKRASTWAALSFLAMLLGAVASVYYWATLAAALPKGTTRAAALEAQRAEPGTSLVFGAITLFGLVALLLGIRDALRQVRCLPPLEPVREAPDNNEMQQSGRRS